MTDGYPTTARAVKGFTATCGHEVLEGNEYIVKRPGVFHCSPACADADKSTEITIRLVSEGSLEQLLHGVWGSLFWMVDNGDGTYGVHGAGVADDGNTIGEAFLRVVLEKAFETEPARTDLPPAFMADPELDVEEWMEKLRVRLGWGDALNGQEMD